MRRARRSTGVYEVAKKCAVVRAEAAMDSPVRCELGRGAAVMMSKRVTVMTADGKSVDRCLLTRPVEGWTSFKCLAASAQRPPPDPKAYRDQKIDAILASEADGAPSEPRVAAPAGAARGAAVVLGFWGSSHELVADHTALWVGRGLTTWTHVPSPGEDAAAARGALAAFLAAAPADRLVVHCLSNNGFSWLNAFCEDRGDLFATAAFVFDSAPHVPKTVEDALAMLIRAQTAKVCQAFGEPPDPQHPVYRPRVERFYGDGSRNPFPGLVGMEVSIPKARPTLFVYSRMDSVILPEHVEEYVATYDAADVSTLEFATVPHIGGMRVRKDEYNRSVDALLARAFPASDGSGAITEAISAAS